MIMYLFKIICTVRHALRTVNIKALLLHALRRTVVIKYMSLYMYYVVELYVLTEYNIYLLTYLLTIIL